MDDLKDCLSCCDELIELVERESEGMSKVFCGELYDCYAAVLEDEIQELREIRRELQRL